MLKTTALATLISVLGLSYAHAASHNKMVFLNQYDLDGNWELHSEEFNNARRKRFDITDEDNNQVVSEDEYVYEYQNKLDTQLKADRKGQIRQTLVRFKAMDKNENGQMEWQEYEASGLRSFARYDTNEDGQIDAQDEAPRPYRQRNSEETLSKAEKQERRERTLRFARSALRMPTTHNKEGMFSKYDSNEDGAVTTEEHTAARKATFALTDEDNNGWLSEDEYLNEYLARVDTQIVKTRKRALKQTYVRFKALDSDEDGQMTFEEYQASGRRMFARWDTDQNAIVTMDEAMPAPRESITAEQSTATQTAANQTTSTTGE